MDVDVVQVAAAVMPYVTAAVTTYGMTTLDKIRDGVVDKAPDAGVSLEHRIPNQIRKALAAYPQLAQEVAAILASAPVYNQASGERLIAIGHNPGIANTGENASFNR
jgi:hypothetical protein